MSISWILKYSMASVVLVTFTLLLAGCYADQGKTMSSGVDGFGLHTNRTIGVSFLTPKGWEPKVGIGGVYTVTDPASDGGQIYVSSSPLKALTSGDETPITTFEGYKQYRLSQITEDQIGPELQSSVEKASLADSDAWNINYSFKSAVDGGKWYVHEIFTLNNGTIYRIQSYNQQATNPGFIKVFETMTDSYRILEK